MHVKNKRKTKSKTATTNLRKHIRSRNRSEKDTSICCHMTTETALLYEVWQRSSKWFKVSLKPLLLYPYIYHDYLTQLYVLHTDL